MSAATDLDLLKDIPEYKTILKGVIKIQLQLLVEQLAQHTEEESIILTASVSDGTLSHLGTSAGKQFLDGHDEIKTQFLGFCLSTRHTTSQHSASLSDSKVNDLPSPVKKRTLRSTPSAAKRPRIVQSTVARVTASGDGSDISPSVDRRTSTSEKKRKFVGRKPGPASSRRPIACTSTSDNDDIDSKVKLETASDNQDDEQFDVTEQNTSTPVNLPPSIHLPHTQTAAGDDSDTQDNDNDEVDDVDDFPPGDDDVSDSGSVSNIKVEPITEGEFGSEITGAERSENAEQPAGSDWGPDTSTAEGDDSVDQSPNKSAYRRKREKHICGSCGQHLKTLSGLRTHEARHENRSPFQCCGKPYYSRANLVRHQCNHHVNPQFNTDIKSLPTSSPMNDPRTRTNDIDRPYNMKTNVTGRPYNTKTNDTDPPADTTTNYFTRHSSQDYSCNICGKHAAKKVNVINHINSHIGHKPYICSACNRSFVTKQSRDGHFINMHVNQKFSVCGICKKSFRTTHKLHSHMLFWHKNELIITT